MKSPVVKLFAYVDVPILLWVPGCKFLGADYGVAIAQPFDYVNLMAAERCGLGHPVNLSGSQWGTFNTILLPYILSWKLPCDFRVKTALAIGFDDGTTAKGDSLLITRYAHCSIGQRLLLLYAGSRNQLAACGLECQRRAVLHFRT